MTGGLRTLVIDTATQALSLCLFDGRERIAHHHEIAGRGHAEKLMPAIAALPDGGRADRIAVDVGPGSFTGVRIGLAAARALAFAWGVSLSGYSALALIAAAARAETAGDGDALTVAITGGHGELFWQQFDGATLEPLAPFASTPIAELAERIGAPVVHGSGAEALVAARGFGTARPAFPDSSHYPLLPASAALPPRPLYGRGADAKPMAGGAAR